MIGAAGDDDVGQEAGSAYVFSGSCLRRWYPDGDGDGYGFESDVETSCDEAPTGYVGNYDDCDDSDAGINPDATEVCSGIDDDCDGLVDDEDDPVEGATTFYEDLDGDGYGSDSTTEACEPPSGYVEVDGDCDDTDAAVHPGAAEIENDGIDQDCKASEPPDCRGCASGTERGRTGMILLVALSLAGCCRRRERSGRGCRDLLRRHRRRRLRQ